MWSYIAGGVLLVLVIYFLIQGIRCSMAVKESKSRLATYNARTIALSYGDMTYVDSGEGEVILSVHGIFGGYDQAYDTCEIYQHLGCRLYNQETADNGVTRYSLVYQKEPNL